MAGVKIQKSGSPNSEILLIEGDLLGRHASCRIVIDDPKVSAKHAKVIQNSKGDWELVDLGSRNRLRQGQSKVSSLVLVPGTVFSVGSTEFVVISVEQVELTRAPIELDPLSIDLSGWKLSLRDSLKDLVSSLDLKKTPATETFPAFIQVDVISGPFLGTKWVLSQSSISIGTLGKNCFLASFQESGPEDTIHLSFKDQKVYLAPINPRSQALCNQKSLTGPVELSSGDVVSLNSHTLEFTFIEPNQETSRD